MTFELLSKRLHRAFALTSDLVESLEDNNLFLKIPEVPSNSIQGQLWCMLGARESYLKALPSGEWQGFNCSMQSDDQIGEILDLLSKTSGDFLRELDQELNKTQLEFVYEVYEHEIQHHGQLIRYIYANKLTFPKTWKQRYTV